MPDQMVPNPDRTPTDIKLPPDTPPTQGVPQVRTLQQIRSLAAQEIPEINSLDDKALMDLVLEVNPALKGKISNPMAGDAAAAREQQRLLANKKQNEAFTRSLLDALPGIGSILGGVASTPETLGTGTVAGVGLGAAGGRWARDKIAEGLGMEEPTGPLSTSARMALDAGLAGGTQAAMPGIHEIMKRPMDAVATAMADLPWYLKRFAVPKSILERASTNPFAKEFERSSTSLAGVDPGLPTQTGYAHDVHIGIPVPEGDTMPIGAQGRAGDTVSGAGRAYTEGEFYDPQKQVEGGHPGRSSEPARQGPTHYPAGEAGLPASGQASPENLDIERGIRHQRLINKLQSILDDLTGKNAPAVPKEKGEEEILQHYKDTRGTMEQTPRSPKVASTPIVRGGSRIVVDAEAVNPEKIKVLTGEGFKIVGTTPDGHLIFKK